MEVLIAMVIVAFVITGAALSVGRSHNLNAHLEKKMAADIAARNLLDRFRFNLPANRKVSVKNESGAVEMAGYNFTYIQTITPASMPELKKLEVVIMDEEGENTYRSLSTFVAVN